MDELGIHTLKLTGPSFTKITGKRTETYENKKTSHTEPPRWISP
jgi:hypothetical protein